MKDTKFYKFQLIISKKVFWFKFPALRGTTSLTAWKTGDFCEFKKKKYCIECLKILKIYLCINNEYTVMFSNENIRFSASYPPSPESSKKKKSSATAAVIVAFAVPEIKKPKIWLKWNIFPIQWPSIVRKN